MVILTNGEQPSKNQLTTAWPLSCTATIFSSSASMSVFLSNPAITLSAASSKSSTSISFLSYLAANMAASLHKLAISAPEKPGVKQANLLAHSSKGNPKDKGFKCTLNIYFLPSKSGKPTSTERSNLPGLNNAASNNSFRFVAAKTMTLWLVPKPSISTNN